MPSPSEERAPLDGTWRVERIAGWIPPAGLRKHIDRGRGSTRLAGIPVGLFAVRRRSLVYRALPLRDELEPLGDGSWSGRGLVFGREFCRFRLVRK